MLASDTGPKELLAIQLAAIRRPMNAARHLSNPGAPHTLRRSTRTCSCSPMKVGFRRVATGLLHPSNSEWARRGGDLERRDCIGVRPRHRNCFDTRTGALGNREGGLVNRACFS